MIMLLDEFFLHFLHANENKNEYSTMYLLNVH